MVSGEFPVQSCSNDSKFDPAAPLHSEAGFDAVDCEGVAPFRLEHREDDRDFLLAYLRGRSNRLELESTHVASPERGDGCRLEEHFGISEIALRRRHDGPIWKSQPQPSVGPDVLIPFSSA